MKLATMCRWVVFPGVLAALMLHAYTGFRVPDGGPDTFTSGLFALSRLPYLACLVAGMRNARGPLMAACAIPPLLLVDFLAFHGAIIDPTTSTSSLTLLVAPVINLVVLLLGFLAGWIAFALLRRMRSRLIHPQHD